MKNIFKRFMTATFGAAMLFSLNVPATSAQTTKENKEQMSEGRKDARQATKVLNEMMKKPDDFIPRELLERASAIAIFPDVVKAAFIIGGRGGDGVVSRRTATGWSAPVFYNMGGASFGAQIGAKKTDHIMLFMNEGSLRDLLDEKVEFGGALSFAAGPVGRTVGAGTNPTLDAGILTWSRSAGAFVGASVKGAVLTADNSKNEAIYGMTAKEILSNPANVKMTALSTEIKNFSDTVARYAGNKMTANLTNNQSNGAMFVNAAYTNQQNRIVEFAKMRSPQRLSREIRNELLTLPRLRTKISPNSEKRMRRIVHC